ncbi:hypothetical protein HYV83_05730 [Candidatus Woesearchaeota archaeon]|nr:hypothetical protein [Candidatus Woesearchaeota archaeon]
MPEYKLTPEQAVSRINVGQLGNAFNPDGDVKYNSVLASTFALKYKIKFERVGRQKLMHLDDVVNAARESGKLTPELFENLLLQQPYQQSRPVPVVSKRNVRDRYAPKPNIVPVDHEEAPKPNPPVLYRPQQPKIVQSERPEIDDKSFIVQGSPPKPAVPQEPPPPRYVPETLPPYESQPPNIQIDFSQKPEPWSFYQYAAELRRLGEGPFFGLEEKVAILHPFRQEFVNEIQEGARLVYNPGLNMVGVITGIKKDSKSGELVAVSIDFGGTVKNYMVNAAAQKADLPNPKIWGNLGISGIR